MNRLRDGVFPTMITPYTDTGEIDYGAVDKMMNWYIERGVAGVFAVCQSSEMFYLSRSERARLARRVVEAAGGRVAVVASGHVSDGREEQIRELKDMADAGVDAVVLVSNRLARDYEPDSVLIENCDTLLKALPGVTFGIYECPQPYKRLLSAEVLRWCAGTGRFAFIKDTCCDAGLIAKRLDILKGSGVKLYNANTATLLDTLKAGCAGFSGIMANFHPELYVWLQEHFRDEPEKAETLSAFLSLASGVERGFYPACAKYHMRRAGVPMPPLVRGRDMRQWTRLLEIETDQLILLEDAVRKQLGISV